MQSDTGAQIPRPDNAGHPFLPPPCNHLSLSLSFSLLPPPALSRFVQPDRRWGERVEGTVRERARLPDDTPANRWRVWRGNDGLRLWFSAITIYFGRNECAEKRNFWNFDYRSARVNGERSGKRRLGYFVREGHFDGCASFPPLSSPNFDLWRFSLSRVGARI